MLIERWWTQLGRACRRLMSLDRCLKRRFRPRQRTRHRLRRRPPQAHCFKHRRSHPRPPPRPRSLRVSARSQLHRQPRPRPVGRSLSHLSARTLISHRLQLPTPLSLVLLVSRQASASSGACRSALCPLSRTRSSTGRMPTTASPTSPAATGGSCEEALVVPLACPASPCCTSEGVTRSFACTRSMSTAPACQGGVSLHTAAKELAGAHRVLITRFVILL